MPNMGKQILFLVPKWAKYNIFSRKRHDSPDKTHFPRRQGQVKLPYPHTGSTFDNGLANKPGQPETAAASCTDMYREWE